MPASHLYVVAQGTYSAADLAVETWQTGIRCLVTTDTERQDVGPLPTTFAPVASLITDSGANWTAQSNWYLEMGVTDFDPVSYLVDHCLDAWTAWLNQTTISSLAQLRSLLVYPIGSDGRVVPAPPYAAGSPARLDITSSYPDGGGSSQVMPLQISVVASHRTAQVGRRGRGRSFVPAIASSGGVFNSSGRLSPTSAGIVRDAQVDLLEALKRTSGAPFVIPAVIGSPWTDYALINEVRVGNVFDTQRRRRRSLEEAWVTSPVDNT